MLKLSQTSPAHLCKNLGLIWRKDIDEDTQAEHLQEAINILEDAELNHIFTAQEILDYFLPLANPEDMVWLAKDMQEIRKLSLEKLAKKLEN